MTDHPLIEPGANAASGSLATQVPIVGSSPAGARGTRRGRPQRRGVVRIPFWWVIPALLITLVIHYIAIGVGSIYSFTDWTGIGAFRWVGLQNYISILTDPSSLKAVYNTFLLAVLFLIVANVLGMLFALALNKRLKTRHILRVALFAPVVLSSLAVSFIWQFIFDQNGPLNGLLKLVGLGAWQQTWLGNPTIVVFAVLVVVIWQHIGLTMVIYLAGLANIPEDVIEAAAVDGASPTRIFFSVTLPLLRPTVVIATTLILIRGLGIFDQVIGLTNGGPDGASETLATLVYQQTFVDSRYGYGAALSLILTVIIVIFAGLQNFALRQKED